MRYLRIREEIVRCLNGYPKLKSLIKSVINIPAFLPGTTAYSKRRYLKEKYMAHIRRESDYVFASIARFCVANRPVEGYYFEFGCHTGGTMSLAYDYFRHLFDWKYVAFDSFEGLPEIKEIDRQEIWQKGKLATKEAEFVRIVTSGGMPRDRLITVRGFYEDSLTSEVRNKLLPGKAAVVYVDCDLYSSTVPVLEFVRPFLQRGTVIVFDDWNCFWADPDKGERRAFREFREKYPELIFEEFISTHMQKAFVFIRDESELVGGAKL